MKKLNDFRILVSNDDSLHAEGINILYEIACTISDDVWIVAPDTEQSGASHSLSLRKPLRIKQFKERHFAVTGTPTDAVLLGVKEILKDKQPDLILSGINHGTNLGEDITYSGTVAAAIEGCLLNIPAIAFSQQIERYNEKIDFTIAKIWARKIIENVMEFGIPINNLLNINFPLCPSDEVKGIKITAQGKRSKLDNLTKALDPDNKPYYWIGSMRTYENDDPDSDLEALHQNYITITPISVNLTNYELLYQMSNKFNFK